MTREMLADATRRGVGQSPRSQSLGTNTRTAISSDPVAVRLSDVTGRSRPTPPFANAIGYLRVSTEEQADSRLGLEAQRASVTAAAARLGVSLRDVSVDAAVSGALAIAARPVLVHAVSALQRGDVLLVAKRDRLGRDVIEVAMIERLVRKRGARVVSAAGEGTDNDDPSSILMRRMVDAFAEYERLMIAARTRESLAAKRARGERAGQLPFGFQLAADGVHVEPNPVEQDKDARLWALRATGLSTRKIAAALNAAGVTTRNGTPYRHEYVARRLRALEH